MGSRATSRSLVPAKPKQPRAPRKKASSVPPITDGRPTKRTPEARARILEAVEQGNTLDGSAKYAGMHPDTLREWRRDDAVFYEAVEKAREKMRVGMLACLTRAAVNERQWQAAAWKLERCFPEDYARKFQPVAMVSQQAQAGDEPGKIYRVAIEPVDSVVESVDEG